MAARGKKNGTRAAAAARDERFVRKNGDLNNLAWNSIFLLGFAAALISFANAGNEHSDIYLDIQVLPGK